jgi:hypothetical protein
VDLHLHGCQPVVCFLENINSLQRTLEDYISDWLGRLRPLNSPTILARCGFLSAVLIYPIPALALSAHKHPLCRRERLRISSGGPHFRRVTLQNAEQLQDALDLWAFGTW